MPVSFVSEPIVPLDASFDTSGMARGEPGVPHKFRWRKKEYSIVRVLEQWKGHGDCTHGSSERYVRKHGYRVEMSDGSIFRLFFKRSFGRGKFTMKARWWIQSIERDCSVTVPVTD